MKHELFATCARGVEETLAAELTELGMEDAKPGAGGARFRGTQGDVWRANLWLRTANHVLWPLGRFPAIDARSLYDGVREAAQWSDHLRPHMAFAVDVTTRGDSPLQLRHTHFVALRVKDAIVDAIRDATGGERPSIDTRVPDVRVHAHLEDGLCALSLDTSGESLHRRGYRGQGAVAPLKETLAAALIRLAGWTGTTPFLDPMCGSGTLVVEAALLAGKRAPGLGRSFGFEGWLSHDAAAFTAAKDEAAAAGKPIEVPIAGSDADGRAIAQARRSLTAAGLGNAATLFKASLEDATPPGPAPGLVLCNPPYGERLEHGDPHELDALYRELGSVLKKKFAGYTAGLFTGNLQAARAVGLQPSRRHVLYNGAIECRLLRYELYEGSRR